MIKKVFFFFLMIGLFSKAYANYTNLVYEYKFNNIDGDEIKLDDYKGKIIVVVNVASRCGYTPQYDGLQKLWTEYKERDLVVMNENQEIVAHPTFR